MTKKSKRITENGEYKRLMGIYQELPPAQLAVAEGLIREAARLRVRLDALWRDLKKHGETELFSQSAGAKPYERERPASRAYTSTNKNYQAIIKQLNDLCPNIKPKDALDDF